MAENGNGKSRVVSKSALRRQREREQRYQTILAAAEKLFASEGYHGASMERIAELAEVSVGTVYFYFKNKEDLLLHLLNEIAYTLRELVGSKFRQSDATMEGFKNAGLSFFSEFCTRYPEKLAIIFRESVGQSPGVEASRKAFLDKFIGDVAGALNRLADTLGVSWRREHTAEVLAVSIVGMYERLAYQYLIWQDPSADLMDIADDALSFIEGGLKNLWGG
ncbi:MAG: helix-turn-helix transcriptional regulator [Deltaproteobacteria bacterium]|nr:helix-turn-helix transcriptional regulator [Deltaproteobacteria bacterium]